MIFLKIWFRKTKEKIAAVMAIIGLTFIVRKKQFLCPHSVGCFSFSSLSYDSHATCCKQSNFTNKPHFGIDLGVSSSMSCTIGAG